jgi:hypothetical protein
MGSFWKSVGRIGVFFRRAQRRGRILWTDAIEINCHGQYLSPILKLLKALILCNHLLIFQGVARLFISQRFYWIHQSRFQSMITDHKNGDEHS